MEEFDALGIDNSDTHFCRVVVPYGFADAAVYYIQKIKRLFRKSNSGKFQKI